MSNRAFPLTGDRVLGNRYRLVRSIARGGMAEVWEAHDDVLARPVAVKVLHPHLADDPSFVERFRREAVAAARLTHSGIVATYDTGADDRVAFIVMELVPGRTLRQALAAEAPLPPAEAVRIAAEVADALDHAHRAGLVHRDVKPGNILLCDDHGGRARVKVADFGIAKQQGGGDLTQAGAVVGTAKYLSPEQVEGRTPDARSDVYALGVVLYEMLCGRPPYAADTEVATALQHVQGRPAPPRRLRAGIPPALESVVLRAMAKDPAQRYQTAVDLAAALRSLDLGDDDAEPMVVRDPTPPDGVEPIRRPGRRPWVPAAAVLLLVGAAVAVALSVLAEGGGDGTSPSGTGRGSPAGGRLVTPAAARSFDPQGDGEENEASVGEAIDRRPATSWSTKRYNTREFGNLKDGVGLVVLLDAPGALRSLEVRSPSQNWAAAVYVADAPRAELAHWGAPVDSGTAIDGDTSFDLGGRRGRAVLLWITDPGEANRTEVSEISIRM